MQGGLASLIAGSFLRALIIRIWGISWVLLMSAVCASEATL